MNFTQDRDREKEMILVSMTYEMKAPQIVWDRIFGSLDELLAPSQALLEQLGKPWDQLITSHEMYTELKRQLNYERSVMYTYLMSNGFFAKEGEFPTIPNQVLGTYFMLNQELEKLQSQFESFSWPSTDAPLGNGDSGADDWTEKVPKVGMLKHMGYKVGEQGLGQSDRQKILQEAPPSGQKSRVHRPMGQPQQLPAPPKVG